MKATAPRRNLSHHAFKSVLEAGCGTGKNSSWPAGNAAAATAADFSEEMPAPAKEKVQAQPVHFVQADIAQAWNFTWETDKVKANSREF